MHSLHSAGREDEQNAHLAPPRQIEFRNRRQRKHEEEHIGKETDDSGCHAQRLYGTRGIPTFRTRYACHEGCAILAAAGPADYAIGDAYASVIEAGG
jgi:hypothetical protein